MMEFDQDDFLEDFKRKMKGLGDYHLRSALSPLSLGKLIEGKGKLREVKAFRKLKSLDKFSFLTPPPCHLMLEVLSQHLGDRRLLPHRDELIQILEIERTAFPILYSTGDLWSQCIDRLRGGFLETEYTRMKYRLQNCLLYLGAIISDRAPPEDKKIKVLIHDIGLCRVGTLELLLAGDLIGIRKTGSTGPMCELFSLDAFRMLVDKVTERDNVLIATELGSGILPSVYPSPSTIRRVFAIIDSHLRERGNNGYTLVKAYEALVTGIILSEGENTYCNPGKFLSDTISNLDAEDQAAALELTDYIRSSCTSCHHMTQLMGLFRLWGHPEVDSRKGIIKSQEIGKKSKSINPFYAKMAGRKFKEIFVMNYYKRTGAYPNCYMSEEGLNLVTRCIETSTQINLKDPLYHIHDWDDVHLAETFNVPETFNLSMIVSDTAISPTRTEIYKAAKEGKPPMDPMQRRGVLKWIREGTINCKDLLRQVDEHPIGLDLDHLAIGLYPKEREINPTARMFSLMTLIMRTYVTVTESMLSDHILPCIPGVTMTYNLLDLSKEMVINTKNQAHQGKNSRTFCINMDFEKWNLNMRYESTYHVFQALGELFGMKTLYNKTYSIFKNSVIYLADGSYVPEIDKDLNIIGDHDPAMIYTGHIGGFEGLRQKGWTIFTVVMIGWVCDDMNIQYKLMGQGDNQVLMLTVYSDKSYYMGIGNDAVADEIRRKLLALFDRLVYVFGQLELPLKPLETWISDIFFSYGKFPIYNGVPLSASLKRLSRVFYFSNEDLMTMDNAMGAVTANAQSAMMSDVHPCVSYVLAKFQHLSCARIFLRYHPLLGRKPITERLPKFSMRLADSKQATWFVAKKEVQMDVLIMTMVTVPKTLGGFNTISVLDTFMRGFSDPATKDMTYLMEMARWTKDPSLQLSLQNWVSIVPSPTCDYSHLIQDPTSINLLTPPSSLTVVRRMIQKTVRALSENQSEFANYFLEVMDVGDPVKTKLLADYLTAGVHVNPRFAHDILGASLIGYSESITSKVDKTVTLSRIALASKDIVLSLMKGEERFWSYFYWRSQFDGGVIIDWSCPSKFIDTLRDQLWNKTTIGISTPHPVHAFSRTPYNRDDSYVHTITSDYAFLGKDNITTTLGHALPYLGSVTQEKVSTKSARTMYGTEPLLSRPVNLQRVVGWFIPSQSNWSVTLSNLLESVTDISPDEIRYVPDVARGSMSHRYKDYSTKHGSLWMGLYGPATHLSVNVTTLTEFPKGGENVTLNFQALMCLSQYVSVNSAMSTCPEKSIKLFVSCPHCIKKVNDTYEDLPIPVPRSIFPSRPENPYLYIHKGSALLARSYFDTTWMTFQEIFISLETVSTASIYDCAMHNIAGKIASSVIRPGSSASASDLALFDRLIFLKLDPEDLYLHVAWVLFIKFAAGGKEYPTFENSSDQVVRTLSAREPSCFSDLAGIFLIPDIDRWAQGKHWFHMPFGYPPTSSDICLAAKRTLISFIKTEMRPLKRATAIWCPEIWKDSDWYLKFKRLAHRNNKLDSYNLCDFCVSKIFHPGTTFGSTRLSMQEVHCDNDHMVMSDESLSDIKVSRLSWDDITKFLPEMNLSLSSSTERITIRSSTIRNINWIDHSSKLGSIDEQSRLYLPPSEITSPLIDRSLLDMVVIVPTQSIHRVVDALSVYPFEIKKSGIIVLGDGYGYSSIAVKAMYPECVVVGWTMIDISALAPQTLCLVKPPTHNYLDLGIIYGPSIECISDVNNQEFDIAFLEQVGKYGITAVVSEIEYFYVSDINPTNRLIRLFYQTGIREGLLKCRVHTVEEILGVAEIVRCYYSYWKIFSTASLKIDSGYIWCGFSRPRLSRLSVYISGQGRVSMFNEISRQMTRGFDYGRTNWEEQGATCFSTGLRYLISQSLDNYFNSCGITHWEGPIYTKLLLEIKTGRKHPGIISQTGRDNYYRFLRHDEALFKGLMVIALSLISNKDIIFSTIGDDQVGWGLKWTQSGIRGGTRSFQKWSVYLHRLNKSPFWNKANRAEIYKWTCQLRAFWDANTPPTYYDQLMSTVRFEYHKPKSSISQVHFRISKAVSYSQPHVKDSRT